MIAHSMAFSRIVSSDQGAREHYHVPKYQREYTWGKNNWETLLQDIAENDQGYFMGSLICVSDGELASPGDEILFEVVDGQQRLTTLSLLMVAIYDRLTQLQKGYEFEDEEDKAEFQSTLASLRNKLVKRKKQGEYRKGELGGWMEQSRMCFLRVQPSSQNRNLDDYKYLLGEVGLINRSERPPYFHARLMGRANRFFLEWLPVDVPELRALVSKINQLQFVHISVSSQADAFTLFETLNNRGVPLSAIDIIKNKMLSEMERQHRVDIDDSYTRWQDIVEAVPETGDQERFLRQVYNAFRWDPTIRVEGIPRAVKSKLIAIYERLIKKGAQPIFERLCAMAELYGHLLKPESSKFPKALRGQLTDLARVNAAPAYQVLLYLFSLENDKFAEADLLAKSVDLLERYYVRRNVTDFPNTRDLDQAHMDLIQACHEQVSKGRALTYQFLQKKLLLPGTYSSQDDFAKALRGSMYTSNGLMTRYLLVKLDETHHSREYKPDLWARNEGEKFVWTVEHVLPQTENIPKDWVKMIADGDPALAPSIHEEQVNRLGNLTLSGYNSKLATASFAKKQALNENRTFLGHSIDIGYRNGLALNKLTFAVGGRKTSLATASEWTGDMIDARTEAMVDTLLKMYALEGVD